MKTQHVEYSTESALINDASKHLTKAALFRYTADINLRTEL